MLTPEQISFLDPKIFSNFTISMIDSLSQNQTNALTESQIKELPTTSLSSKFLEDLSISQTNFLVSVKVDTLSNEQFNAIQKKLDGSDIDTPSPEEDNARFVRNLIILIAVSFAILAIIGLIILLYAKNKNIHFCATRGKQELANGNITLTVKDLMMKRRSDAGFWKLVAL